MAQPNPHAVPVYAVTTETRVVRKIVAWHMVCLSCGKSISAPTRMRQTCNELCRQKLCRRLKRQAEREAEQAEEQRLARAEAALVRRRAGRGRADHA